ncbi:DNA polymerase III subunit beta [Paenibacillus mesophilus]|uniref:DNA polymerase III subunit beta n=1 Tax=Paenibacillus mesophilus TaxID=2582849 RepID=UPI00110E2C32|nr:DNA polymerase III subunit beta [Paenibacillus mesophilus]TMV50739.1 DNA polymerase III subunit beta [Paenibacillus mesophilus]
MRVAIPQPVLSDALQQVARAVPANSPIPILYGIHIRFHPVGVTVAASNGVMTIHTDIRQDVAEFPTGPAPEQEAALVVPARYLIDIVRKLPPAPILLELTNRQTLTVRSGDGQFRLFGLDPALFPETPRMDRADWRMTLSNGLLKSMIRQVAFAVSSSEARPLLSGVLCKFDGRNLRFVATDSVRFASRTSPVEQQGDPHVYTAVIPGKGLSELAKLLDEEGETAIVADEAHIRFRSAGMSLYCSLLQGAYPPIDKLVPSNPMTEVTVDTYRILRAIERVTLLAGEGSVVQLRTNTEQTMELLSGTTEIGDVREELRIESMIGPHVAISFNGKYMADIIRAVDSESVTFRFTDKLGPITAVPVGQRASALYLLTPIRTAI